MRTWKKAFKNSLVVGTLAGLTSLAALVLRGRCENGSAWSTVNAPSHWVWGDPALREDAASLRYTLTGLAIHQLSSGFWALVHEKLTSRRKGPPTRLRDAAVTSAIAALVDLKLVPHRLTPGFQKRLSSPSLVLVYTLFGLGLAAGSHWLNRLSNPRTTGKRR